LRGRRLSQTVRANLAEEFNKRTVHEAISTERDKIMTTTRTKADADAKTIGVEIVDVRLRRVELPPDVTGPVYARMESERRRVANELRSFGQAESEKIRADADRQRVVILADAYKTAQKTKGDGDAKASAIYAQAYGANPEFYAFYRSLEAYKATFRSKSDVMVLDPGSEFFRYLKNQGGAGCESAEVARVPFDAQGEWRAGFAVGGPRAGPRCSKGLLPLLAPRLWRESFARLIAMSDGQLRFIGLASIVVGLVGFWLVRHA
jgi:uncharacterized protein YjeT (DUF2065 family)